MKHILNNSIVNIENTDIHDNIFLFDILQSQDSQEIETIYISDLLERKKNGEMLEKSITKPASYSNVYSPKDELEIFTELFNNALKNNKKIHIVGITLKEELEILEQYYLELGFFNTEINCFSCDFSKALVTVSCKIENIMYRGSDYKRMGKAIFFNPPIRESGQVKALFKGINRGVIAGLYIGKNSTSDTPITEKIQDFLSQQITEENILPITLGRILRYNLDQIGLIGDIIKIEIQY